MSNDKGKNPNDQGKNHMLNDESRDPLLNDESRDPLLNDESKDPLLNAFHNLSLHNINNNFVQGESSNNNNNNNFNVNYNIGQISLRGSQHSRASSRPHMLNSSWITQPNAFSGQPSASTWGFDQSNHQLLCTLLDMMTCQERYKEFIEYLEAIGTNETMLLKVGSVLTEDHSTFLHIARDQTGSHALRALFKSSPKLNGFIFDSVCLNFMSLMVSKYGRFLIVPTIRAVDKPRKEMLYELTYNNTLLLAKHETGCIALNEVFQEIKGRFRDQIFDLIAMNAHWLASDPYGTHVVQYILTLENPHATQAIAEKLGGSFFRLSMGRQESYVVEKCLRSEFGIEKVLEEFRGNDKEWIRMANDKFGNYVAQCALKVMKKRGMIDLLREFVEKLRPHFREMKFGNGKNTLRVIQEEIEEFIQELPPHMFDFLS